MDLYRNRDKRVYKLSSPKKKKLPVGKGGEGDHGERVLAGKYRRGLKSTKSRAVTMLRQDAKGTSFKILQHNKELGGVTRSLQA